MKPILFDDIKFEKQWRYENSETGSFFKSGIIPGALLYTSFTGDMGLEDVENVLKALNLIYEKGRFHGTYSIRIIDLINLNKTTYRAWQHYLTAVKQLNKKYNYYPTTTYICTSKRLLKASFIFAEKFLNQNFVFVANVEEAFQFINKTEITLNNERKGAIVNEDAILIRKEEIDKTQLLISSAVWGGSDNQREQKTIPFDSPLSELYQSLQIMISDKEESLEREKNITKKINKNLLQQKLLANVSFEFTKLNNFEDKVNNTLRLIGEFTKVSRVYIFEDSKDSKFTKNTFEWCNESIKPQIDELQAVPYKIIPSWKKIITEKGKIFSIDISELPQDLIEILKPQGIKSIIVFPINIQSKFIGFIGFDECVKNRGWDASEVELLKIIANIISILFEQRALEQNRIESEKEHTSIIESTSEGCWVLTPDATTIYVNKSMCEMLGYTREEMIGKSPTEFVDEENAEILKSQRGRITDTNNRRYEITLKSKFDKDIPVIINSTTLYNNEGNEIKTFAFVTDITERKNAEAKLKKNEHYLKQAEKIASVGYWEKDLITNQYSRSEELFRIYDIDPLKTDISNSEFYERLHPYDVEKLRTAFFEALEKRTEYNVNFRLLLKDGTIKYVNEKGRSEYNKEGTPILSMGIVQDITEIRKREILQKALFEISDVVHSDKSFTELYSSIHTIIKELIPSKNFKIALYDSLTKELSYPYFVCEKDNNSKINQSWDGIVKYIFCQKKSIIFTKDIYKKLQKEGKIDVDVELAKIGVGVYLNFESTLKGAMVIQDYNNENSYNSEDLKLLEFISKQIVKAIDKKYVDKKRRESERKNRSIIDALPDDIYVLDINGIFGEYYSHNNMDMQPPRELIGESIFRVFSKKTAKLITKNINNTLTNKKMNIFRYSITVKGSLIHYEARMVPFGKKNVLVAVRCITDIVEAENKLLEAKEKAERADELKSTFLAQMSHEIRTPVNSIVSLSSMIQEEYSDIADEDISTCFNLISKSGDRIIRTTDLMINLSEIQAGTYEVRNEELNLSDEILRKLLNQYSAFAKEKNLELKFDNKLENPIIHADAYTIEQIFNQLIDNAIKFTESGTITIRAFKSKKDKNIVEIIDTGVGISEEYFPSLFSPFSQEEMGYTRKYEGNGVGLVLVKKYCNLNNLTLEVKSEKGKGSTFRVLF